MTTTKITPSSSDAHAASEGTAPTANPDLTTRIMNVFRLQFVDRQWLIYTPLMVLAFAFLVTLTVFFIARISGVSSEDMNIGLGYSWAALAPMWYLPTAGIMAINPTIHMAFAFSITRRDFYLGTIAAFIGTALLQGVLITLVVGVERVSEGYGFGLRFADANIYLNQSLLNIFVISTLLYFSVLATVATVAVMYLRWRVKGVLISIVLLILVFLAIGFILALTGSWPTFLTWLSRQTAIAFLWVGAAALLATFVGYFVIRRIAPIN